MPSKPAVAKEARKRNGHREGERARLWYENNKERSKATRRAYYLQNREKAQRQGRAWQEAHPEQYRRLKRSSSLKRKYGITLEQYEQVLKEQGSACAICLEPPPEGKYLNVDHCHATQRIRGLLCQPCNRGLGQFRDHPERIDRAAAYLREPTGPLPDVVIPFPAVHEREGR